MANIDIKAAEIGWLDRLARRDTSLQRIDPRAKLITTLAFIVVVVSYGKYQVAALFPLAVYPLVLMAMGEIPSRNGLCLPRLKTPLGHPLWPRSAGGTNLEQTEQFNTRPGDRQPAQGGSSAGVTLLARRENQAGCDCLRPC